MRRVFDEAKLILIAIPVLIGAGALLMRKQEA